MASSLQLTVNGIDYGGWKTIDVARSIQNVCGTYNLELTDLKDKSQLPKIKDGDRCQITISSEENNITDLQVMAGFVDSTGASLSESALSFSVQGRDVTADIVDCSLTGNTGEFKDIPFENLVELLVKPFGVQVAIDANVDTGEPIESVNYDQGTKVFELIAEHAQLKGLLVYTQADGSLLITRVQESKISEAFIEGDNILEATISTDVSEVYGEYIVKGSRETEQDEPEQDATQIKGEATDARVGRFRPIIILPDGDVSTVDAQTRANWEATTRLAKSEKIEIVIQGWLPVFNRVAYISIPSLTVDGDYLIESYNLIADGGGKRTTLVFVQPRAYDLLVSGVIEPSEKDSKLAGAELQQFLVDIGPVKQN
jgi:prophage tail gpP-like protein